MSRRIVTFSQFFSDYYRPLRLADASPRTVADYRSFIAMAERWAREHHGPDHIEAYNLADGARFLSWALETRSRETVRKYRRYSLALMRFAHKLDLIDNGWFNELPQIKPTYRIPQGWRVTEIERLLAASQAEWLPICDSPLPARLWWRALFLTIYDTGLRISAALALRVSDVNLIERFVIARAESQKQRADQYLRVSEQAVAAIIPIWCPHRELLFPLVVCRRTLYRRLDKMCQRGQVPHGGTSGMFHRFRVSNASYLAASEGIAAAQSQLGHSSLAVTAGYMAPDILCPTQAADVLPRPKLS
jgi:integrase